MSGRKRLLLVDDNANTLDLLELFLYSGYDLTTAENGFEGLRAAEAEKPDLIVSDIMMPVMDGIAFLNELRRRPETAAIPVVAATSFAEPTTVKSLLNVGFSAVVAKPFNRSTFMDTVSRLVGAPAAPPSESGSPAGAA
jgi:CheY-like chemotaxis protein